MEIDALGNLFTVVLFGVTGAFLARRMRVPVSVWTWALLGLAAIAGLYIRFWILSVGGFTIRSSWAIPFGCLGVMLGLAARTVGQWRLARRAL